jgi:hypothetical protein
MVSGISCEELIFNLGRNMLIYINNIEYKSFEQLKNKSATHLKRYTYNGSYACFVT